MSENKPKTNDDLYDENRVDFTVSSRISPTTNIVQCGTDNQLEEEQEASAEINNSECEKLSNNQNLLNIINRNVEVVIERLEVGKYSPDKCKKKIIPSCKVVMRELQQSCSGESFERVEVCF